MSIDLKKLRHVIEVERSQGITRAAKNLMITQSALTRSLADTEAELGVELFQRLPRGVRVTEAGRHFVGRARRILGEVDDLLDQTSQFRNLKSGTIEIGFSPGAFQKFFAPMLVKFAADHPGIRMSFFNDSAENHVPKLLSGEMDLIIGSARQFARWQELEIAPLKDLYCKILVRKDHPLTKLKNLKRSDMVKYPWIQASSIEPIDSDLLRSLNLGSDHHVRPHYMVDDFDLVRDIVRNTDAASPVFSPSPAFDHLKGEFALLDNILEIPTHALAIVESRARQRSPVVEEFIGHIEQNLPA